MKRKYIPEFIWRYGGVDVIYRPDLDGAGTVMAPTFVSFIKNHFGAEQRFGTVFEWCAGPGFIGFALLAENICGSLCLADINPAAMKCAQRTIEANQLQDRVRSYLSDNLTSIPRHERFDLVVGNPPNFFGRNPEHPAYANWAGSNALRSEDPGWRIHEGFYSDIASFLNPGAFVVVDEVALFSREVFMHGDHSTPWDIRPEEPAGVFTEMIRRGGLAHIGDYEFLSLSPKTKCWMQVSQKPIQ